MELTISTRLRNVLIDNGVASLEQAAAYPKRFWATRPLCSLGVIGELKSLLQKKGLDFAPPKTKYIEPVRRRPLGEIAEYRNSSTMVAEAGDVYFVGASGSPYVKIGFCKSGGIKGRLATLQIGCPLELRLLGLVSGCGRDHEQTLHNRFAATRHRGEWFLLTPEIEAVIEASKPK
jgi:hypothetical protein